jgi:polysaccharide biosynthesis/export protein
MKPAFCLILAIAAAHVPAQQGMQVGVSSGATSSSEPANLPVNLVGPNDLLGITVYDSPELSHPVRVDYYGDIRLPMVKQPIPVAGLDPAEIEVAITKALAENNVLVEPLVSVTVLEVHSRPITVMGAVRNPTVFQADGPVTLLDVISRAGGLSDNAGSEILLNRPPSAAGGAPATLTERISVESFLNLDDAVLNLKLEGGDIIRVPGAGQIYVLGAVKRPGAIPVTGGSASSVLKVLAVSGGLDEHPARVAYIYRLEGGAGGSNEIAIEPKKIIARQAPDVAMKANDMLYVPTSRAGRINGRVLDTTIAIAVAVGATLLVYTFYR